MVFDKYWFKENQRALLKAVNHPLLGGLIRRGMWIEDREKVVKIAPESVHVLLSDGQVKATFYASKQFSEALRKNFAPLWKAFHTWDMQIANPLVPSLNLGFDTYTSQPDDTTGVDTFIVDSAATTNFDGNAAGLGIGEWNGGAEVDRTLIKFDLSSIPSTNIVSAATLSLWYKTDWSSNDRSAKIYRVLKDWVENQATWNIWKTANNWTTAGCSSVGNDYDSTVWATATMSATATVDTELQWIFDATGVAELQKFVNATYSNYGWLMKADTETNDLWYFHASHGATSGFRPKLVITHSSNRNFFLLF